MSHTFVLHQLDAIEFLKTLADESVDLSIHDPAYESLEKWRKQGTTTRLKNSTMSSNKWFSIFPNDRFPEWLAQMYRVHKKNTHFYVLCDEETRDVVKPLAVEAGWRFWKSIVWDKMTIGMGYHYRARVEWILFFEKGKRRLNNLGTPDLLEFPEVEGSEDWWRPSGPDIIKAKRIKSKTAYPTQKPEELLEVLIQQSSQPGELVIDTFFGSGSTARAALKCSRRFAGSDLSAAAHLYAYRSLGVPHPEPTHSTQIIDELVDPEF